MTVSQTCLLITVLMPFVWTMCAKSSNRYDNREPRRYLGQLEGWRARAFAAHQNSWEALALFTAALVVAWHNGANVQRVDQLAIVFVASRVLHGVLYLLNWATLRSLAWTVGLVCVVWLFFAAP
ncbi:MAPEG family protein [Burkholderia thailandensis]|uniref:Probable transmembrane protein n=1 Tax=Burkholderia thailandensis (strain ATCC 700388 / DSM 13276 / CCUG 48851 / CIP 106301 / E264) TaxID=271848 RepID=Q2T3X7_BURTA|nr:MAPEG family protein [Burkholderia thailandensis]ABC35999.1 probable transmembrane protein [Burkholderia thailandensis E264]AHI76172.1 MAPEG family protein [Burkholderia thailandensis 2002721723]AHI81883.1 MAPEG family protein [Burkholderia thailandensis E444]AIC90672.1 MAPEG family protein [Burkholderia thailandensis USAMRU Malaysia \